MRPDNKPPLLPYQGEATGVACWTADRNTPRLPARFGWGHLLSTRVDGLTFLESSPTASLGGSSEEHRHWLLEKPQTLTAPTCSVTALASALRRWPSHPSLSVLFQLIRLHTRCYGRCTWQSRDPPPPSLPVQSLRGKHSLQIKTQSTHSSPPKSRAPNSCCLCSTPVSWRRIGLGSHVAPWWC